jgi:hypothetical protein
MIVLGIGAASRPSEPYIRLPRIADFSERVFDQLDEVLPKAELDQKATGSYRLSPRVGSNASGPMQSQSPPKSQTAL